MASMRPCVNRAPGSPRDVEQQGAHDQALDDARRCRERASERGQQVMHIIRIDHVALTGDLL